VITLTDSAATKVKDLIAAEGEENLALRVAVRPGGCSGFSYEMFFDTDVVARHGLDRAPFDALIEAHIGRGHGQPHDGGGEGPPQQRLDRGSIRPHRIGRPGT